MFDFLLTINNYNERKVINFQGDDCEGNKFTLDTVRVTDSSQPFETAISHPFYNDNDWAILESYDTKEESIEGHAKWLNIFVNESLPETIKDHIVGGFEIFMEDNDIEINRK